jgi:ubiquinone/menaquinone biosynthesis C-methylase UbiE
MALNKNTSWGGVADWYDNLIEKDPDSYQKNVIMPNLMRILGPIKGLCIADIACGQGYFSRAFAHEGAKVNGFDVSKELIETAREHSPKGINYTVCSSDIVNHRLPAKSVDIAIIVLALQNIEKLSETINACKEILKSGSRLVIILNHPAFRIPGRSSWEWSNNSLARSAINTDKVHRRIDAYMSDSQSKIDMTPGEKDLKKKKYTISFHRPLQSYMKALSKHGFAITKMEEWISHKKSSAGPRASEEDRIRKEIPLFLCIEARTLPFALL